jgi:hypothetical protein
MKITREKIFLTIAVLALVICFVLEIKKYRENLFEPIINHSEIK